MLLGGAAVVIDRKLVNGNAYSSGRYNGNVTLLLQYNSIQETPGRRRGGEGSEVEATMTFPIPSMIESYIAYRPDILPLTSRGINRQIRGFLHALITFLKHREEWYIK
jgi:hypothetical protein